MSEIMEKFERVAGQLPESGADCLAIIITQIDPDAIGGALGLAYILRKKFNRKSDIFYCGLEGHAQNRGHVQNRYLFNKYNLTARIKPIAELTNSNRSIALVDSNSICDDRLPNGFQLNPPIIVIDHHCENFSIKETDGVFLMVDNDVGATCTLIIELMQSLAVKLDDEEWGGKLATILALGLFQDTKELVAAGARDINSYNYVTSFCLRSELAELRKYKKPPSYYTRLARAIMRMERKGARLVTGIGSSVEYPDDVAEVADELLRMEGITLVFVWVIVSETVRLSARSDNPTFSLNDFIQNRFGSGGAKITPDGHSEGGVAIELRLGRWLTPNTREKVYEIVQSYIADSVFAEEE